MNLFSRGCVVLPDAQKVASRPSRVVFVHKLPIAPVTESVGIVLRVSAGHGDDCDHDQANEEKYFERRHDEFRLSIPSRAL